MSGLQDSVPKSRKISQQPHVNRSNETNRVKEDRSYGYGKNDREFEVFIHEGEMEKIREWTLKKDNIKTGGDLFGLWIDEHTAVVQFVLGPGVGCRRTTASFYQDVNYLEKAGTYLTKHHGLCNIGQWHSHHRLSLSRPSGGDENTVWGNLPKLAMDKYIVFIANIESIVKANVNCFLFEIHNGCQLPVLEGKFRALERSSPFRENKLVLDKALPGQEDYATDTRIANRHTKENYTGDHDEEHMESESKSGRTKHAEGHGKREDYAWDTKIANQTTKVTYIGDVENRGKRSRTPSVEGLDHDESGKSESGSKHSPPRKQEKGEAQKIKTTADYINPKEKVTHVSINNASNLPRQRDESRSSHNTDQAKEIHMSSTKGLEHTGVNYPQYTKETETRAYINNASNLPRQRDESGFAYNTDQVKEPQISSTKGEHTGVKYPQYTKETETRAYINNASNLPRQRDESGFAYNTDQVKEPQISSTKGEHTGVNSPQYTGTSGPVILAQPESKNDRPYSFYDNLKSDPSKTPTNQETQVTQPSSTQNSPTQNAQHEESGKKSRSKSCFC